MSKKAGPISYSKLLYKLGQASWANNIKFCVFFIKCIPRPAICKYGLNCDFDVNVRVQKSYLTSLMKVINVNE